MIRLNGTPVVPTVFPDKTSQVWKLSILQIRNRPTAFIEWIFDNEGEFMVLAQLKDLLDAEGYPSVLKISYLPYGRQDKEVSNNATFALRTFANLLNSLEFEKIQIVDPHSKVALELIGGSEPIYPLEALGNAMEETQSNLVCYPDHGAFTKYSNNKYYNMTVGGLSKVIYGEKVRDQLTGNITSYKVVGDCKGKRVLIVDDICDGGATFKILAKDLLAAGAESVSLFVTHGIFSRGVMSLFEAGITDVFTADGNVRVKTPTKLV